MQPKVALLEKHAYMDTLLYDFPGQQGAMLPALVQNSQASVC
jgi:hypothetical protein